MKKGKMLLITTTAILFFNCVIIFAGTKSGNVYGTQGNVAVHYFIDRTEGVFYDYNTWRINVFGEDKDSFVIDSYSFDYTKPNGDTVIKQSGENIRSFDMNNYTIEILSYHKNTSYLGIDLRSDVINFYKSSN